MTEDDRLQTRGRAECARETRPADPADRGGPSGAVPRSGGDVMALLASGLGGASVEGPLREPAGGRAPGPDLLEEEALDLALMSDFLASLLAAQDDCGTGDALRIASGGSGSRRRPRPAGLRGQLRRRA